LLDPDLKVTQDIICDAMQNTKEALVAIRRTLRNFLRSEKKRVPQGGWRRRTSCFRPVWIGWVHDPYTDDNNAKCRGIEHSGVMLSVDPQLS
jgi:hypothetical protein